MAEPQLDMKPSGHTQVLPFPGANSKLLYPSAPIFFSENGNKTFTPWDYCEYKQGGSSQQSPTDPGDNTKPDDTCPELVLKVRIQSHKENDFIEVELDRQELSYQNLLQASCYELGINPEQVEKIRKLPNTLLRKDKDILRLQDFQEVELILMKNGSSALTEYTPSLLEKPCYNSNAAKMTY